MCEKWVAALFEHLEGGGEAGRGGGGNNSTPMLMGSSLATNIPIFLSSILLH